MGRYEEHCQSLLRRIKELSSEDVLVAFSGGVDGSLILKLACNEAKKTQKNVYAVMLHTMLHPSGEVDDARKIARETGAEFIVLEIDELENAGITDNPSNRCYRCKKYLFQEIQKKARELGIRIILEGTNEDDLHVYRPGIQAVRELGILSPLAETGFTKEEVRKLASEYHMPVSSKPSTPCLATRFPYGTILSYEAMRKVEQGETYLRSLGFYNVRLRVHGDMARIEVDCEELHRLIELRKEVKEELKGLGYMYITADLEGFRSGSMDEILI